MKNFLIILSLLYFCSSCSFRQQSKEAPISIRVNVINRSYSEELQGFKGTFYLVEMELLNNTDSAIQYWTMTCSWDMNWKSSTDSVCIFSPDCTRNFPTIKEIRSKSKSKIKGVIRILRPLERIRNKALKFGFVLISKKEISDVLEFDSVVNSRRESEKGIIWSEPFLLDK